jgi:hypothetical protein
MILSKFTNYISIVQAGNYLQIQTTVLPQGRKIATYLSGPLVSFLRYEWNDKNLIGGSKDAK